jgi:hypothetical protein
MTRLLRLFIHDGDMSEIALVGVGVCCLVALMARAVGACP